MVETTLTNRISTIIASEQDYIINRLSPAQKQYQYSNFSSSGISSKNSSQMVSGYANMSYNDPRIIALRNFLLDYNSPMYPYADIFIYEADRYGLDWRLVVSISGVESAFGRITPINTNNAWGWRGGRTENGQRTWSSWNNWAESIADVTRGLAVGYGTTLTPSQIEPVYCPPCSQDPTHPWANGVTRYMRELDMYLNRL